MILPIPVITSIISAISIISGSALGAWCSWVINNKIHKIQIEEEHVLLKEKQEFETLYKTKEICSTANSIKLDVCTAIFQSIRFLECKNKKENIFIFPINKNYSFSISLLCDYFNIRELSYIYQFYGLIETINNKILMKNYYTNEENFISEYKNVIKKVYGLNYEEILKLDINSISYEELINNEYIKPGYREILSKLDNLCKLAKIKDNK